MSSFLRKHCTSLLFLFVVFASFLTYFWGYWIPNELFWDENYHLASAMKYLTGTFFMEQHPPLGKLLIAAGEWLMNANVDDTLFIGTDYGKSIPETFSFVGYRLFPTLLAWLTAPLLWLLFQRILRNIWLATLLSFFYIFDTALIVHARSAMLESTLLFGMVLTLLLYTFITQHQDKQRIDLRWWILLLFGASFGIVMSTKVTGLIIILLLPLLLWQIRGQWQQMARVTGLFFGGALVVWLSVWYMHFALATTPNTALENKGYYQSSVIMKEVIDQQQTGAMSNFTMQLQNHLAFGPHYNRGVPELNLCKDGENGSPWFFWPIGARSINYRWESAGNDHYAYLYLQSNPIVWWLSFLGVLLSILLLAAPYILDGAPKPAHADMMFTVLILYICYMIAISQIERVMYLYHYFPPLIFSMILFGLAFDNLTKIGKYPITPERKLGSIMTIAAVVFLGYLYYQPLAYYQPMTSEQVENRAILQLWDLECIKCTKDRLIAQPK